MPSVLEVRNLRVTRGDSVILNELNWRVEKGEHWVILGANGSGKTSLLAALTAYLTPSAGSIELLDARFGGGTDWRELRRRIGIVSSSVRQLMADTEPALISIISGKYAMIDYWGSATDSDRLQAMRILRSMRCEMLAERPWRVLSQGERQRVLIGRALMAQPEVLILDEPCAGLDPVARESFLQFVQQLGARKRSPTLILVTHHVEEIMPVFTHALLLKGGGVIAAGRKSEVLGSRNLSATFGASARVTCRSGRYQLRISPAE